MQYPKPATNHEDIDRSRTPWGKSRREYEEFAQRSIPEEEVRYIYRRLCTPDLKEHLAKDWDDYTTPALIKQEIVRHVKAMKDIRPKKPIGGLQEAGDFSAEEWREWFDARMPEDEPNYEDDKEGQEQPAGINGAFRNGPRKGKGKGEGGNPDTDFLSKAIAD